MISLPESSYAVLRLVEMRAIGGKLIQEANEENSTKGVEMSERTRCDDMFVRDFLVSIVAAQRASMTVTRS